MSPSEHLLCTGPFYFTKLLLPALFSGSSLGEKSRVINVSSAGSIPGTSYSGSGLDFAAFKDSPARRKYNPRVLYDQSKLVRAAITRVGPTDRLRHLRAMLCSLRNYTDGITIKSLPMPFILVSFHREFFDYNELTILSPTGLIRSELGRNFANLESGSSAYLAHS